MPSARKLSSQFSLSSSSHICVTNRVTWPLTLLRILVVLSTALGSSYFGSEYMPHWIKVTAAASISAMTTTYSVYGHFGRFFHSLWSATAAEIRS